ncbi:MAG TPA: type II secretion system protein GspG [Blastocatellia bacterium]|nr:type II secretion system protein GspG [Blastocatellia bacterium]
MHCYAPVGSSATRVHAELARKTSTTHRPDPTVVFSPEKHEAMVRRARSRKRMTIAAAIGLIVIIAGSITLNAITKSRREAQKLLARDQAAHRELNLLAEALDRFKADVSRYPTNEEGIRCLSRKPAAYEAVGSEHATPWYGPYLENVPEVDPWGNDYVYHTSDGGRTFELFSTGPGGEMSSDNRYKVTSR